MQPYLVTVLYNSESTLPGFLNSLRSQTLGEWRLIAVDNASRDRSCEVIAACDDPRITLLRNRYNFGFAKATNQGLRLAAVRGGAFFVVINNDTVFDRSFLMELVNRQDELRAQVIAPRIMRLEDPTKSWYAGGHFQCGWEFKNIHQTYDPSDTTEFRRVDFASGCCLGMTLGVMEDVGLFDERFFVYWEDTDFCLRLKRKGIPIFYVREPHILHAASSTLGGEFSPAYNKHYYRSYAQLLRKHFGTVDALRRVSRLLMRDIERGSGDHRATVRMGTAMLKGMASPPIARSRADSES